MRVIFLDFDGVLHSVPGMPTGRVAHGKPVLRAERVPLFAWVPVLVELLQPHPDVRVIVHSSWRVFHSPDELREMLGGLGERFMGCAPPGERWACIRAALDADPRITDFLVLDDAADELLDAPPQRVLLCDPHRGLSDPLIQERICLWLNSGELSAQLAGMLFAPKRPDFTPLDGSTTMNHTFLFIDTEFTSLEDPHMISLGVAGSDGHEYYVERTDFPRGRCSAFVVSEVLPKLAHSYAAPGSLWQIGERLQNWLDPISGRQLIVAYDYADDWRLFISTMPESSREWFVPVDVRLETCSEALEEYLGRPDVLRHYAIDDARALRHACESWTASMHSQLELVDRELATLSSVERLAFWRAKSPALGDIYPAQAISEGLLPRVIDCAKVAASQRSKQPRKTSR